MHISCISGAPIARNKKRAERCDPIARRTQENWLQLHPLQPSYSHRIIISTSRSSSGSGSGSVSGSVCGSIDVFVVVVVAATDAFHSRVVPSLQTVRIQANQKK